MWTKITRPKYEREGRRYASDVTDAEWALIEPHMPAVKRLGGRVRPSYGPCWMRSCISREPAVSGACCQRTFLRLPPCKVISTIGETTACLRRSILRCCWKHAKQRAGTEPLGRGHRQSIGQDDRERWAAGVRCGQEGKRPQAPHCDRYWRSAGRRRGAPRRCPRSRWCRAGIGILAAVFINMLIQRIGDEAWNSRRLAMDVFRRGRTRDPVRRHDLARGRKPALAHENGPARSGHPSPG